MYVYIWFLKIDKFDYKKWCLFRSIDEKQYTISVLVQK